MKYSVDRIENDKIIVQNLETLQMEEISKDKIPFSVRDGDILKLENNTYQLDEAEKEKRKKMVARINCIDEHAYRTDKFLSESVPTTSTISDPTTRFEQAFYCLALARALLAKGELVLADEPTRALDLSLRNQVAEPFIKLRSLGKTVVIVSHDPYFKEISDQVIELK